MTTTQDRKPTEGPPTSVGPLVTSVGASATEGTALHDMHVPEKARPEPPEGLNAYEKRRWEQQESFLPNTIRAYREYHQRRRGIRGCPALTL